MRNAPLLLAILTLCAAPAERSLEERLKTFVSVVRDYRSGDLASVVARLEEVRGTDIDLYLRRSVMPTGPRQWITLGIRGDTAAVERVLKTELGAVTGRGFGGEDGWLLPGGGLIVERWKGRIDLTFSPGPPQDALEDLSRPRLPSHAGDGLTIDVLSIDDAHRTLAAAGAGHTEDAVTAAIGGANPIACVARENEFIVAQRLASGRKLRISVWRRPFAQWNEEIQRTCAR